MVDVCIPVWNTSFLRRAYSRHATGWARGLPPSRRRRWRTRAPTVERARRRPTPHRHTRCPTRACNADDVQYAYFDQLIYCWTKQFNISIKNYQWRTLKMNHSGHVLKLILKIIAQIPTLYSDFEYGIQYPLIIVIIWNNATILLQLNGYRYIGCFWEQYTQVQMTTWLHSVHVNRNIVTFNYRKFSLYVSYLTRNYNHTLKTLTRVQSSIYCTKIVNSFNLTTRRVN